MTYTVTVRGLVPADIVEKMSQVLAQARRQAQRKTAGATPAAKMHPESELQDVNTV